MAKNPTMSFMDSMRDRTAAKAAHPLAHVLALNNDPGIGMKNKPMPGLVKPVKAFAKGGKVASGGKGKLVQFYAKGGAVKSGAKCMAKGGKAKVMGTVGEAKQVIRALKSVKRPMTPPPGLAAASPMGTPPMAPGMPPQMKKGGRVKDTDRDGMKRGGKVRKLAAGGSAKVRLKSPMPKPIKKVPYVNGG